MDFNCDSPDLSRARLDAEIMRENLLVVKNSLLDQAGLIKVLESKDARNKLIEFENQQLSSELKRLTQRENSIPHVIDSLNTKIEELQCKLKSQELINEQLQTRTDFSKERNRWMLEEEKYKRAVSKKEKENVELKAALNEAGDQVKDMKLQIKHCEIQNNAKFEEMKRIIEGLKNSLVMKEKELFNTNFSLEKSEKQVFELEIEKNSLLKDQILKENENIELKNTIKEQEQLFKEQKEKLKEDFEWKIKDIKTHMNDQIVSLKVSYDKISKENSDLNKILDICNFEKCKFEKLVFDLQSKINEAKNGSHNLETYKKAAKKPLLVLQAQSSITVSCLVMKNIIEEASVLAPAARLPLKNQRKIDGIEKLVSNGKGLPLKRQRPQRTSLQNEVISNKGQRNIKNEANYKRMFNVKAENSINLPKKMKITEETLDFSKNDMVSYARENKQDFLKRKESKIAYNEPYAPINNPSDPYYFKPIHISLQESLINLTESDIKIFMENFSWIKKLYNSGMEFNKISISALADTMKKLEPNSVCFLLIRELLGCLDLFSSEDAFEIMRIICIETCENPAWAHQFLGSLKTIFIANVYKGTKFTGKEKKIANKDIANGKSLQAVLHANYVIVSTFYNYQEEIITLNEQLKERNDQELLDATAQYRKI